ncbi:hypothetical protein MVI01_21850 [Myxococcus virescens]|uniref:Uncharacterized protein n=1 Tax=Myxococcus virescens TaxID=83456 RepID=A0A511HA30_9BACT|nr:hypothetical protein MVI01_21850 [Myxococcus virescens]
MPSRASVGPAAGAADSMRQAASRTSAAATPAARSSMGRDMCLRLCGTRAPCHAARPSRIGNEKPLRAPGTEGPLV